MRWIKIITVMVGCVLFSHAVLCQITPALNEPSPSVHLDHLTTQGQQRSSSNIDTIHLLKDELHITHELAQTDSCIQKATAQLNEIKRLFESGGFTITFNSKSPQYTYLYKEKLALEKKRAYCEFHRYQLLKKQASLSTQMVTRFPIIQKDLTIWSAINGYISPFDWQLFYQNSGWSLLTSHLIECLTLLLVTFALSFVFYNYLLSSRKKKSCASLFTQGLKQIKLPFIMLPSIMGVSLYLWSLTKFSDDTPFLLTALAALNLYFILSITIKFLLLFIQHLSKETLAKLERQFSIAVCVYILIVALSNVQLSRHNLMMLEVVPPNLILSLFIIIVVCKLLLTFCYWSKTLENTTILNMLGRNLRLITGLILVYQLGMTFLYQQLQTYSMLTLLHQFFVLIFNGLLLWMLYLMLQAPSVTYKKHPKLIKASKLMIFYLSFILIAFALFGYIQISEYLVINLIMTGLTWLLIKQSILFIKDFYIHLSDPKYALSQKFRRLLSINYQYKLIELYLLRLLYSFASFIFLSMMLILVWAGPSVVIAIIKSTINGINIFNTQVSVPYILRGVNDFCGLMILGRMLIAYIERNKLNRTDQHTKTTIVSILHYIIFILASIISLTVAGINFKGIALIAGALSVGLGFGLQHFISDLVSGILLMINKPIQIGDHVIIDGTEGFIKRIGLLSTQLRTLLETDVIIPNSNLIIKSVTNLTFQSNRYFRFAIQLTLADLTQLEATKEILLSIASTQHGVVRTPPNAPEVTFDLNRVSLWCLLEDVNEKSLVLSGLNFRISQALKDHNITFVSS